MKKFLWITIPVVIVLVVGSALLFYNIGKNNNSKNTNTGVEVSSEYADSEFIKTLEKCLKKRNDISDKYEKQSKENPEDYNEKQMLSDVVKSEQEMKEFKDKEFSNPRLSQLSKDYIDGLETQEKAIDYYESDYIKCNNTWQEGYSKRSIAIVSLKDEFDLNVPEDSMDSFRSVAKTASEEKEKENAIQQLVNSIQFTEISNEYGYKTYEAVVENTTGLNFEYFNLTINLSKDDVILESAYSSINQWESGQKARFEFTTDKDFDKYKITADWLDK